MTVLVVGAGFAGAVIAERLTAHDIPVTVVDKASHVGGTAYDYVNEDGIRVHAYGPHAFHTKSQAVWDYLSLFTKWRPYEHRVMNRVGDKVVPMPVSRATLNMLFGLSLKTDDETAAWYDANRVRIPNPRTSRDLVLAKGGEAIYNALYRDYTQKQWGRAADDLDSAVAGRLPFRLNDDVRYFTDPYQAMPVDGFTAMFDQMLQGVDVRLDTEAPAGEVDDWGFDHIVWTGRPDEFFSYKHGELPFRSMHFREETIDTGGKLILPCGTVNETASNVEYTRMTEYRWLTGQVHCKTTLQIEIPSDEGEPHYPIPNPKTRMLMNAYKAEAAERPDVTFVGRVARYQYMTIDQVVGQALKCARDLQAKLLPAVA